MIQNEMNHGAVSENGFCWKAAGHRCAVADGWKRHHVSFLQTSGTSKTRGSLSFWGHATEAFRWNHDPILKFVHLTTCTRSITSIEHLGLSPRFTTKPQTKQNSQAPLEQQCLTTDLLLFGCCCGVQTRQNLTLGESDGRQKEETGRCYK